MYFQLIATTYFEENEKHISISTVKTKLLWKNPSKAIVCTLNQLKAGINKALLSEYVSAFDEENALLEMESVLHRLMFHGLLTATVFFEQSPILTLIPLCSPCIILEDLVIENKTISLSRFAFQRCIGEDQVLETPLSATRIIINDKIGSLLLFLLRKPCSLQDLSQILTHQALHDCLRLLLSAKAIQEEDSSLLQWEFHDLLFHTRSRSGRHANPSGGIYPFKGKIPPLVANKAVSSTLQIPLYRPDIEKLKKEDSPFALVVESRSSKRAHDNSNPISIQQLGEFLFRAARIKKMFPGGLQELSSRPYPSGGALYELEIYPLIYHCKGVERGLYHYDPYLHQLSLVTMNNDMLEALLQSSASSADRNSHPQILFIISSRFQRRSWKYCSIAYATSLKNVGILFQNMYLVGTAMNLATSAIGLGNSDLFAKVIGSNYYEETSLGEFILGTQESYATI